MPRKRNPLEPQHRSANGQRTLFDAGEPAIDAAPRVGTEIVEGAGEPNTPAPSRDLDTNVRMVRGLKEKKGVREFLEALVRFAHVCDPECGIMCDPSFRELTRAMGCSTSTTAERRKAAIAAQLCTCRGEKGSGCVYRVDWGRVIDRSTSDGKPTRNRVGRRSKIARDGIPKPSRYVLGTEQETYSESSRFGPPHVDDASDDGNHHEGPAGRDWLGNVEPGDLRDDDRVQAIVERAVAAGVIPGDAEHRLRVFAAAERSLAKGVDNPGGYFRYVVTGGQWSNVEGEGKERIQRAAEARIRALDARNAPAVESVADEVETTTDSEFERATQSMERAKGRCRG